jgi:hypothetical protein
MIKKLLPLCLALAALAGPVQASSFQAVRLAGEAQQVKLDGLLDEALWQQAPVYDTFIQQSPVDKVPAHVKTEVRLVYDQRYLYIGVKAFDPKPDEIRAPFARRDKASGDQDFVGLFLDPSGARKSAQFIYINPRGAISDGMFTDSSGEDYSPDFDFDVATARFDGGWSMELRLPFSSIAYKAGQTAPWSLLMIRNLTRDARYKSFSGPLAISNSCLLCASSPVEGLANLPTSLNWSATPQIVMRRAREEVAGQPRRDSSGHDLSLDLKVRPDSATVIDATINPDFSQIELDAPQLSGNTRFGLFVQEKRPFFLEGSDMLQTPFRAISTRSITDPGWGARYTRRDADSDVTVLTTHDAGGGVVLLPKSYNTDFASQDFGSQATVARANAKIGKLSVGLVGTDRTLDNARGYNRVLGPDFSWQRSDTERVRGQFLASATTAQPQADGTLGLGQKRTGHALFADWYQEEEKWAGYASIEEISDGFRGDNGFFSQAGYRVAALEYTTKLGRKGPLNELNFYMHVERKNDSSGKAIYDDYTPGMWISGPYDSSLNLRVRPFNRTRVKDDGALLDAHTVWAQASVTPGKVVARLQATVELGDEIDVDSSRRGKGGVVTLYSRLRPIERIEIEPTYTGSWIDGRGGAEDGRRLYTEQALQVNGIFHFSARDTLRLILQKQRTTHNRALYAFPVAARSDSNTTSFVYGRTASLGTAAYVGLTLTRGETPGIDPLRRQNELFVKLSYQI